MITETRDITDIPAVEHDEGMALAATEYDRLLELVDRFGPDDWARETDCPGWDVRDVVSHLLGFMKANADHAEADRQVAVAAREAEERGILRLDAQTALHVREHAHLSPAGVAAAVHEWAGRALAGRTATPAEVRAAIFSTGLPGEADWTVGYLIDVVFTRDLWMHRVDLCRATGRAPLLTPEHDGRIVADVVADWARRHGRPFTLRLDGPAGGAYTAGPSTAGPSTARPSTAREDRPEIRLDAVEFCRLLSGRGAGEGLLATRVPF
jgi:uncharacterized protein (TIGR03083 family)